MLTNKYYLLQATPQLTSHYYSLQMQHFGKGALRVAKNYTKGYSDTQAKVRDATSKMNEIAQLTYNQLSGQTYLSPHPL